ncbi:cation transporter [Candidatus Izemoplasma sp. B36]|uniref:cation transporter n=1 Tax=Candidatus Izemoplasma sp. B36 TaxID=3242468 RepID=UPI003558980A
MAKRKNRSDFSEKWIVAVSLLDKPLDKPEIEEHFALIGRKFGIFDLDKLIDKSNVNSFDEYLEDVLNNLIKLEWIVKDDLVYSLTDIGRLEAQKAYNESLKAMKVIDKIISPKTASIVTFITHIILSIIKLPAAIISGSIGLLSDSLDTLVDAISSFLVWIGIKKKKEHIANIVLVTLMLITGAITLYKAISSIINPSLPVADTYAFIAAIGSAVICLILYVYQRYSGIRSNTPALVTQSIDSKNHILAALSVTAALIAARMNFVWLDIIVGLVVALLIAKSAIELLVDLIKQAKNKETQHVKYHFAFYEKERRNQYYLWLLNMSRENQFNNKSELINHAKKLLDTTNNITLLAFSKNIFPDIELLIADCVDYLFIRDYLEENEMIQVTEKGNEFLINCTEKNRITFSKISGTFLTGIFNSIEFFIIYFLINYLSGLLNIKKLWPTSDILFSIGNFDFSIMNIVFIGVGLILYLYGNHHIAKMRRIERHNKKDKLLTTGYYERARHPRNGMLLMMQTGIFISLGMLWSSIVAVVFLLFMYVSCSYMDKKLAVKYGDEYIKYQQNTKRKLLPILDMSIIILVIILNMLSIIF